MKRFFTFILDSIYDIFGLFFMFFVFAMMVFIIAWRLNILFTL